MKKLISFLPFGILIALFLPFFMTALKVENEGFGMVVFVIGTIAAIGLGILYIVESIKALISRKKGVVERETEIPYFKPKKIILAISVIGFYIAVFASCALESKRNNLASIDNAIAIYFLFAFFIIAIDLFLSDFKKALKLKTLIMGIIAFIAGIFMSSVNILICIPVVAAILVAFLVVLFVLNKKTAKEIFGQISVKALSVFCIVSVAISGCSICLNFVGESVASNREREIIEVLKNKNFARTASDCSYLGYAFNDNGEVARVGNYENYTYTYEKPEIFFTMFGFGSPKIDGYDSIEFDKEESPIAILSSTNDRYELSDTIPEYKKETITHSSGSSTTSFNAPTVDEYITKLKEKYPDAVITDPEFDGKSYNFKFINVRVMLKLNIDGKVESVASTLVDSIATTADGAVTALGVALVPATNLMSFGGNYLSDYNIAKQILKDAVDSGPGTIESKTTVGKFQIEYSLIQLAGSTVLVCSYTG